MDELRADCLLAFTYPAAPVYPGTVYAHAGPYRPGAEDGEAGLAQRFLTALVRMLTGGVALADAGQASDDACLRRALLQALPAVGRAVAPARALRASVENLSGEQRAAAARRCRTQVTEEVWPTFCDLLRLDRGGAQGDVVAPGRRAR